MSKPMTIRQIEKDYPFLEPCCECEYWRYMNRGEWRVCGGSHFSKYDRYGRKRTFKGPVPDICCHYNLVNDHLKPAGALKDDGTCECFKPYEKKKKVKK